MGFKIRMGGYPRMTTALATKDQNSISINEEENPRSIVNLVPPKFRQAIREVPEEFLSKTPDELESMTVRKKWTMVDSRLRTSFWLEYARAQDLGKKMCVSSIVEGICTDVHFYTRILPDKIRVAYLLTPPTSYRVAMENALSYGIDKLYEILDQPINDPKMAEVVRRTVEMLDRRVMGAVVQRTETKNLNVSVQTGGNGQDPKAIPHQAPQDMDELNKRLREAEAKIKALRDHQVHSMEAQGAEIDAELAEEVTEVKAELTEVRQLEEDEPEPEKKEKEHG